MASRCVSHSEGLEILRHFQSGVVGGHFSIDQTVEKVLEVGFFWLSMFNNPQKFMNSCDQCQRRGSLSKRDKIKLNPI